MTDEVDTIPTSGGAAPVGMFAADAVVTLPADSTLQGVADELAGDQIGLVILGSVDDVEGVVSERDVVRAVAEGLDPVDTPARSVASTGRLLRGDGGSCRAGGDVLTRAQPIERRT
jgi:CBS domain-containing protein